MNKTKRAEPYIGIVGMSSISEMRDATLTIFNAMDKYIAVPHMGQVGVQVTDRTLQGELTHNWRCPKVVDISAMFREALAIKDDLFTVIHYTTKAPEVLFESVRKLFSNGDMYRDCLVGGLQLNGGFARTLPIELEKIHTAYPDVRIIQQLPHHMLYGMSADEIMKGIGLREKYLSYVLIDPSSGIGREMDVSFGIALAGWLLQGTGLAVGLAGGLRSENVGRMVRMIAAGLGMKDFSIDAEGGLRDKIDDEDYGHDLFNPDKADTYFLAAVREFAQ